MKRAIAIVALLIAIGAPRAEAQRRPQSLDDVVKLLSTGAPWARVLDLMRIDCVGFTIDDPANVARLKAYGAVDEFIRAIPVLCYKGPAIEVITDPAGAKVFLNDSLIGESPIRKPVTAAVMHKIRVVRDSFASREIATPLNEGVSLTVKVPMLRDTLTLPTSRGDREIAAMLGVSAKFPELPEFIPEPVAPENGSTFARFTLAGILVGGAAFGASVVLCDQKVTAGPQGGWAVPKAGSPVHIDPGQSISLGTQPGCVAAIAGGAALVGGWLNGWRGAAGDRRRATEYQQAVAALPAQRDDLAKRRREIELALAKDSAVVAERQAEQRRLADTRATNEAIRLANSKLPAPTLIPILVDPTRATVASAGGGVTGGNVIADAPLTDAVDVDVPKTGRVNPKAVAVVIGNRTYQKRDVPEVAYAANDARTMRKYLVDAFGFRAENIIYEENASFAAMQTIFGRQGDEKGKLYNYVTPDSASDVFVFYSGHGAPEIASGKTYLVPSDADPDLIKLTGYSLETMYENLAKIPAKSLTVVLDACFSGASDKGMLIKGASPALLRVDQAVMTAKNAAVLAASGPNQISSWYEDKQHGLFSYFVFDGLRNALSKDPNGNVSVKSLADYVTENVKMTARRLKGREQVPQLTSNADDRSMVPATKP